MLRLLLSSFLIALCLPASAEPDRALFRFYHKNYPKIQREYLEKVTERTKVWASRVCLQDETDTLLSIIHTESRFELVCDDGLGKRRSLGFFQTREQYRPALRRWWLKDGWKLGPDDSVDTQCAYGVLEFAMQLRYAHGNVFGAVRRYNGGGAKAQDYARKVFRFRRLIFARPQVVGESHSLTCKRCGGAKWTL